jgi:hypothetical protein
MNDMDMVNTLVRDIPVRLAHVDRQGMCWPDLSDDKEHGVLLETVRQTAIHASFVLGSLLYDVQSNKRSIQEIINRLWALLGDLRRRGIGGPLPDFTPIETREQFDVAYRTIWLWLNELPECIRKLRFALENPVSDTPPGNGYVRVDIDRDTKDRVHKVFINAITHPGIQLPPGVLTRLVYFVRYFPNTYKEFDWLRLTDLDSLRWIEKELAEGWGAVK